MRPGANQNVDDLMGILCAALLIGLLIWVTIMIFYLLTLQKALSRVAPQNRTMEPGSVWWMFVPCVNIVWQFLIAIRVPESLRNEFRARGQDDGSDYGKGIALTQAILGIASSVIGNGLGRAGDSGMAQMGSIFSGIMSLACLALFIAFWVKVANYSSKLANYDGGYPDDFRRGIDDYDRGGRGGGGSGSTDPAPETYRPDDGGKYS